jgi:tetratricopeptide (TPR) repeat protein
MKLALIFLLVIFAIACNKSAAPVATNTTKPINAAQQTNEAKTMLAHSGESGTPKPSANSNSGKWTASGDPIDTSRFDAAVAKAEKSMKAKPDDAAKALLAEAYFERGFALTEARQYASALGDYRRALKLDPNHEESKKWVEQIMGIYQMLKKDAPEEGEEPPPLPFKKAA